VFTVYHVNVVLTNRTTNDRYKTAELQPIKTDNSNRPPGKKSRSKECLLPSYFYDKGIMGATLLLFQFDIFHYIFVPECVINISHNSFVIKISNDWQQSITGSNP
jgi:hypothetical protein